MRSRRRISSKRPDNRKKTNIVSESKNTSWPNGPEGSNVPRELTMKVISMPSATGRSMLTRRARMSRSALEKNGPQANSTTGRDSTHEAQRSRVSISCVRSPGLEEYAGHAYIMTYIMHRPATSQRHSSRRLSCLRISRAKASRAGKAW
ncbi:hypothetical protein D3C78_1146460 [compost metagenome]